MHTSQRLRPALCLKKLRPSGALLALVFSAVACSSSKKHEGCTPQCQLGCGFSDGCGGTCGCADGSLCNAQGQCIPETACSDTCSSAGFKCGVVCQESCGECQNAEVCVEGTCMGARSESCADCSVRLKVLGKRQVGGATEVDLALDYEPGETEAKPRIADFRLRSDRALSVVRVEPGEALTKSGKDLYRSPGTGEPYRVHPDGTVQFLAYALNNVERFASGRLLTVTLQYKGDSAVIRFTRREQVFAPPLADKVIQSTPYDEPVVVLQ